VIKCSSRYNPRIKPFEEQASVNTSILPKHVLELLKALPGPPMELTIREKFSDHHNGSIQEVAVDGEHDAVEGYSTKFWDDIKEKNQETRRSKASQRTRRVTFVNVAKDDHTYGSCL
jgi:hypothetical protein